MKTLAYITSTLGLFLLAIPLKEYGHADAGLVSMIASIVLAIVFLPFPKPASSVKPVTPEPQEIVTKNETHQYNHVIHHHMNYSQVTEATEDSHLLPDGTTVSRRHIRKWH